MDNGKKIKIAALSVALILAAALTGVGIIMISERSGPGTDTTGNAATSGDGTDTSHGPGDSSLPESDKSLNPADYTSVVSDRLMIGDAVSEAAHSLSLSDGASPGRADTKTGTLEKIYNVISFEKKGASAEWKMSVEKPGSAEYVLFEVAEVHDANLETLAYTVYVDGKEVYYRTYEQISSSPNRYFFAVLNSEIRDFSDISLKIVSDTGNRFNISEIIAYTDFFEKVRDQGLDGGLKLYLHSSDSLDTAKTHIDDFSNVSFENFSLGLMFKLNYFSYSNAEIAEKISGMISLAGEYGLPLQLMPSLSWSAPYDIADGRGGSFSDVKYGQVLYNSLTGELVDSTPNSYGNTPWETWGDPALLTAQKTRISDVWTYVKGYLNNALASRKFSVGVSTLIEHSVVYKGPLPQSSVYTMGLIDGGDFSASIVAAAKADGVTLDPTDGLSYREKLWMNEYQAKYVQSLADTYISSYGTDPVIVDNGKITYPTEQMMNNLFSHTVQWIDQTPSHGDLRISGWKSGIGNGFYEASEEFALIDDIRFYQYRVAYGKTANCNFEMSSLNESDKFSASISKLYEAGVDFITLFNDQRSYRTASKLATLDRSMPGEKAMPPVHYDDSVLWVDYNRDIAEPGLLTEKSGVAEYENVRTDLSDGTLLPANDGDGYVIYHVRSDEAWENGIYLNLEAFSMGTPKIRVYAGPSANDFALAGTFSYDRSQTNSFNRYSVMKFDLSKDTKGRNEYYIKLSFEGSPSSSVQVKSVCVRKISGDSTGQKNGVTFTKGEARIMNLWIAKREETNRLIEAYTEKNGGENEVSDAASKLNLMGLPCDALEILSKKISCLLPTSFAVRGEGRLGELPVYVKLSRDTITGSVTINSLSQKGAAFEIFSIYQFSELSRTMELTFEGLEKGKYSLESTGWNAYELRKTPDGGLETANGKITVTVTAEYEKKLNVTELSGRVKSFSNGVLKLIVQDPDISGYYPVDVSVDSRTEFTRRADGYDISGKDNLQAGDFVTLTFDGKGKLLTCESVYGEKEGIIKSFIPPDLTDINTVNGLIEFEDGSVFEIEYQARTTAITLGGSEETYARALTDRQLAELFRPGRRIKITYCPEYYGEYQRILSVTE